MPILSRTRLFPSPPPKLTHTSLSILDATVARFSPTAAIWTYVGGPSVEQLTLSLKETINTYPQWTGQLQCASYSPQGDHTQRQGRLMLVYGAESDPGIEYIISTSHSRLSDLVPKGNNICLDVSNYPLTELLDVTTPLALHNMGPFAGLPCMIIQIMTFADHGVFVAAKMAHPVADAQTLLQFMHDWASINRAMLAGTSLPVLSPIFNPQLLDSAAAGDIDACQPDVAFLETARSLPLHYYDLWSSSVGCPTFMNDATCPPPVFSPDDILPSGIPLPWDDWEPTAPVSHYILTFEAHELRAIWEDASSLSRVSHLDALLAHLWGLIVRARGLESDEEHYLNVTFNFRNRLSPPLPPTFLGSPLTLTKVTSTGRHASEYKLRDMAAAIRSSLQSVDSSTLPALLHEMAFEVSAQRRWVAFFGRRNTIVTSWLHLGTRDVDFGTGRPGYVEAVMPSVDGCVQIMEGEQIDFAKHKLRQWYDKSAAVSLHLRDDVMQRLLKDPTLRKYQNHQY